jgi:hypothetical protein
VSGAATPVGYLLSHRVNDVFFATNRLLAQGEEVYWLETPLQIGPDSHPAGTVYVPAKKTTAAAIAALVSERGLDATGVARAPAGGAWRLKPLRIGVVDLYGGSMPSGWSQWLLNRFGFPFEVVYPPALDAGNLADRFDALVLEDGMVRGGGRGEGGQRGPDPATVPAEFRDRLGSVTDATTVPQLRRFLEEGGTIIAVGSSTALAAKLGVPVMSALVDPGTTTPLPPEKFYAPGSILQVKVDQSQPLAYGLPEVLDVFYNNSPLFRLQPGSEVRPVAWFEVENPVRSGWAWGVPYLKQAVAVADASVGRGRLLLFGTPVAFRAHPHGTFKFLFNGLYVGSATHVSLPAGR